MKILLSVGQEEGAMWTSMLVSIAGVVYVNYVENGCARVVRVCEGCYFFSSVTAMIMEVSDDVVLVVPGGA